MSQDFKLRFDEMRQSNPTNSDGMTDANDKDFFEVNSHIRNLCFVWPDNRRKFYNYAYLISGDYLPEYSSITLAFSTDLIILKGINLAGLFGDLLQHLPRKITCSDERYRSSLKSDKPIIESIEIISNT